MKSSISIQHQGRKRMLILFVLVVIVSGTLEAQRYYRPARKIHLGVEANYGSRSLQVRSDIPAINKLVVMGDGGGFGMVAGGRAFRVRVQQAFYSSNSYVKEKTKLNETNGSVNIYPLQFKAGKPTILSPYLITGFQMSNTKLYGAYVAEPVLVKAVKQECTCTCPQGSGGGPPANPDDISGTMTPSSPGAVPSEPGGVGDPPVANPDATTDNGEQDNPETPTNQDRYLGKISTVRATMGIGLEIRVPGRKRFVNFYGELKYGQPLSSKPTDLAFRNTQVSGMLSIDVGVSVGIFK